MITFSLQVCRQPDRFHLDAGLRGGGGSTTTPKRRRKSAPRSAGVTTSIGFFLAFMMFGSDAWRGSFRRRSVVTTAGRLIEICSPPFRASPTSCRDDVTLMQGSWASPASAAISAQSTVVAVDALLTEQNDLRALLVVDRLDDLHDPEQLNSASVCTRIARSAPSARHVRNS